jgi:5'-nucleotidase/UDP-sugar diphosphatase
MHLRRILVPVLALAAASSAEARPRGPDSTVRIISFSDYHSHAAPFWSEGRPGQGGIARTIAFLREARKEPNTLVVSGGDMLNRDVPAWSDEFGCVEWPWFKGLLDGMALGNHDLDYGLAAFEKCRGTAPFPVLSANLLGTDNRPWLRGRDGRPYLVKSVGGVRIGLFAVAGADVQRLIEPESLPEGARFADPAESARAIVKRLRDEEGVSAVVAFGHQLREEDLALARAVPGIDLVLGSHSHDRSGLITFPGTTTRYIAAHQYLTHLAEVRLRFEGGRLSKIDGKLVAMDAMRPEDPEVATRVVELHNELARRRPERFEVVGKIAAEISDDGLALGESPIANWATEALRQAASAQVFFTTASSIRGGLPPGLLTRETFLSAFPYTNRLVVMQLTGAQVEEWLRASLARLGTPQFSPQSGLRYRVAAGRPSEVQIRATPSDPAAGFVALDANATYRVATTDYQATHATGYREIVSRATGVEKTEIDVHNVLLGAIKTGALKAILDGRHKVPSGGR